MVLGKVDDETVRCIIKTKYETILFYPKTKTQSLNEKCRKHIVLTSSFIDGNTLLSVTDAEPIPVFLLPVAVRLPLLLLLLLLLLVEGEELVLLLLLLLLLALDDDVDDRFPRPPPLPPPPRPPRLPPPRPLPPPPPPPLDGLLPDDDILSLVDIEREKQKKDRVESRSATISAVR